MTAKVKTGFLMPKELSERAQAIAKSRGISMRTLLVEAIELGIDSMEATELGINSTETPVVEKPAYGLNNLLDDLTSLAKLSTPTTQTRSRHKPTKTVKPWRFS